MRAHDTLNLFSSLSNPKPLVGSRGHVGVIFRSAEEKVEERTATAMVKCLWEQCHGVD